MKNVFILFGIAIIISNGLSSCSECFWRTATVNAFPALSEVSRESYTPGNPLIAISVGAEGEICREIARSSENNIDDEFYKTKKTSNIFFSPGINYSRQGGNYVEDNGLKGKVVTSYINVSLLYRYHSPGGFYAEAGLQPGILLSSRDKYLDQNDDYSDNTNKFHLGVPIGIGYRFKNGFGVGVRVIPGLTSIHPTDDAEDEPNKNFVAGLKLSCPLALGKKK